MRQAIVSRLFLVAPACAFSSAIAHTQKKQAFYGQLTAASAAATSSGGGGAGDEAKAQEADLDTKHRNPVAALIDIPAQNNWDFGIGPAHAMKYACNIQPFLSYTTKIFTTFGMNTETTYNWQTEEATVPMNWTVQQLVKIGKLPVAFQLGYRYYVDKPNGGPDWGLRFAITFLFPKN